MSGAIAIDLPTVLRTLYDETNFQRDLDRRLCEALATILPDLKQSAMVARFGGRADVLLHANSQIAGFDRLVSEYELIDQLIVESKKGGDNPLVGEIAGPKEERILVVDLALDQRDEHGRPRGDPEFHNYCAFLNRNAYLTTDFNFVRNNKIGYLDYRLHGQQIAVSYVINHALRYRNGIFSRFPGEITKAYWVNTVRQSIPKPQTPLRTKPEDHRRRGLQPPWSASGKRRTATLSLDMRRSTFIMDQAADGKSYADWMEGFVLILRRVALDNLGVFDKFTGDGVIVHFLEEECRELKPLTMEDERRLRRWSNWRTEASAGGQVATCCAVACAFEMIWAVEWHMLRLRQIVGSENLLVGPAVGIAIDQAQWSVDRDGAVIVVGRGVVQACRVGASAERGTVRMTTHSKQMVRELLGEFASKQVAFTSKEFAVDAGVISEELTSPPEGLCRPRPKIELVAERVWEDVTMRSDLSP